MRPERSCVTKLTPKIRFTFFQKRVDTFAAFRIVEADDKAIAFQRHLTGEIALRCGAKQLFDTLRSTLRALENLIRPLERRIQCGPWRGDAIYYAELL